MGGIHDFCAREGPGRERHRLLKKFYCWTRRNLRDAGLSRQKIAAVKDLAAKRARRHGSSFKQATPDERGRKSINVLFRSRGIGEWSVQMFLMFRLGRPDVLPVNDLGIRAGFQHVYGHKDVPKPQIVLEHGERWRPYRSIASWYLLASFG